MAGEEIQDQGQADDPETIEALKARLAEVEGRIHAAEAIEAKARADIREMAIERELMKYAEGRFQYPALAAKVVDLSLVSVDPETGKVSGAREAIERALKEFPSLGKPRQGGGGSPSAMRFREPRVVPHANGRPRPGLPLPDTTNGYDFM